MSVGWHEPTAVDEAVRILAANPEARYLAGGQTLVAMINAGLSEPSALVSLRRIEELSGVDVDADGSLLIGAMTRHAALARESRLTGALAAVREAAGLIAHPAVRNLGTVGGALAHADPNADFPTAMLAVDAEVEIAGEAGRRWLPIGEFFIDFLTTALEPGELLTRIRLPRPQPGSVGVYEKFARVDGDYATVSVALALSMRGTTCEHIAIAIGACGPVPVRSAEAEALLRGSALEADRVAQAGSLLADACDPVDDVRGSAEYRRMLVPRLVERALTRAREGGRAGA